MKKVFSASSMLLALTLSGQGNERSDLQAKISDKERQLVEIQKELTQLRDQLAKTSEASPSAKSYTVKTGDTIHSIARRHKVSSNDLMSWNKITDPTKLRIGETLTIGAGSSPATIKKSQPIEKPIGSTKSYTVEKGDTFYSIARRHKMTLNQLKALNPDVSTHLIAPGQTIMVSGKETTSTAKQTPKPTTTVTARESSDRKPPVSSTTSKEPPIMASGEDKPKPEPKKDTTDPAPVPPNPVILEDSKQEPSTFKVTLEEVITFEDFAKKYNTDTKTLNELNGWDLPAAIPLARGSEVNVPK